MKKDNLTAHKQASRIRITVIVLVLFSLVLMPMSVYANQGDEIDNILHYGTLKITADDIVLPIGSKITKKKIIRLAKPVATHILSNTNTSDLRVAATFSISDEDLKRVNDAEGINEAVTITIRGIYMYSYPQAMRNQAMRNNDVPVVGSTNITVSFKKSSYDVTFNGNGGTVDGKKEKTVTVSYENKKGIKMGKELMPKSMERKNFTFIGWSISRSRYDEFTENTVIDGDITVYAHWKKVEEKNVVAENKKSTTGNDNNERDLSKEHQGNVGKTADKSNEINIPTIDEKDNHIPTKTKNSLLVDVGNGENNAPLWLPDKLAKPDLLPLTEPQNIPAVKIGNSDVPLYASEGSSGWAFMNLLLTAMGIVMTFICMIISYGQRRDRKNIWFVLPIISSIAGTVLFILTENMKLNIVLTDVWTVPSTILFFVTVISVIKYLRHKEEFEEYIFKY